MERNFGFPLSSLVLSSTNNNEVMSHTLTVSLQMTISLLTLNHKFKLNQITLTCLVKKNLKEIDKTSYNLFMENQGIELHIQTTNIDTTKWK